MKRLHGIEIRRLDRRIDAEEQTDTRGENDAKGGSPPPHVRREGRKGRSSTATAKPSATPQTPPIRHTIRLSVRNCRMISARRAPQARRTPISFFRSVTLISMMFMMTIPPTSAAIAETLMKTITKVELIASHSAM